MRLSIHSKASRINGALAILLMSWLLLSCTGHVTSSVIAQQSVRLMNEQVDIQVVSNSTSSQLACSSTNSVVIEVSVPSSMPVYCRDQSHLMDSLTMGQTCPGGPVIKDLSVHSNTVDCREMQVCGQSATAQKTVAQRIDGTPILQLTFNNLPWACALDVQYSNDPGFTNPIDVASAVSPPVCQFCARTNSQSCQTCPALSSNEQQIAGQVIPITCSGGSCASCQAQGTTIPHAGTFTFYSKQLATCGQPCSQVSQVKVCNNGTFMGDSNYSFSQCQDVMCNCTLAGTSYPSGTTPVTLYKGPYSDCGTQCSDPGQNIVAQCQSGIWTDPQSYPITPSQLATYSSNSCTNSSCGTLLGLFQRGVATAYKTTPSTGSCTAGSTTVDNGGTYLFYSVQSGSCTLSCNAQSLLRTCHDGTFDGNASYSFPSCTDVACSCSLPSTGQSFDSGSTISLYKETAPSCGISCSDAGESISATCQAGNWVDSKGSAFSPSQLSGFPYPTCSNPVCDCSRINRATIPDDGKSHSVYSSAKPTCPQSCGGVTGAVTCKGGVLSGDTSYSADACTDPICSCSVPLASGPLIVAIGGSVTLSKVSQNTVANPNACTTSTNILTVTCNSSGQLTPSYDNTVYKYLQSICQTQSFSCAVGTQLISNGSTAKLYQNSQPGCGQTCQEFDIYCNAGNLVAASDKTTPVTVAQLSSYPAVSCQPKDCTCTMNSYILPYKGSKNFYSISDAACDPSACASSMATFTCGDNQQVSGGDTTKYIYDQCNYSPCSCTLPNGGSILNGTSTKIYSVAQATCTTPNVCTDAASSVTVSCSNGKLSAYDQSQFKYLSCAPAVCSCSVGNVQVDFGKSVWLYSTATPPSGTSCSQVGQQFTCGTDGKMTPDPSADPFASCKSDSDQGDLGGTGGGTGNDQGPGSALKKRFGLGDGGGGGGGCGLDGSACNSNQEWIGLPGHDHKACLLPWGGGEIEFYGSIIAFNTSCVVKPDLCSKHRQSRTCHYPTWTGSSDYKYPSCTEKASCP